jgi:hypothetical protein
MLRRQVSSGHTERSLRNVTLWGCIGTHCTSPSDYSTGAKYCRSVVNLNFDNDLNLKAGRNAFQEVKVSEVENMTGFIVRVTPRSSVEIYYSSSGNQLKLIPGQEVVGYFWQMTSRREDSTFDTLHITRFDLIERNNKKYYIQHENLQFIEEEVNVEIVALRGPESNNRYLSKEHQHLEMWERLTTTLVEHYKGRSQ